MTCFMKSGVGLASAWQKDKKHKQDRIIYNIAKLACFIFLCVSLVWKRAGSAGGVGVHACMGMSLSTVMLFLLPWGKAPQCHCCPYSVAEQGGPGGGAECSTVKRGRSACWHLPSLTAAGRGKICFSICLCSLQPFPPPTAPPLHCPLKPPLSPFLTRWLPEHCLPWVTVPDAECVRRHPHSAQLVSSFLCCLLTWVSVVALRLELH